MKKLTEPLLLIDAMNLVFRSHFTHNLSHEGRPTGAIYGFIKKLHSLRVKLKTNRVVVCWDYGHPGTAAVRKSWRARVWPEYKAGREQNDESAKALAQCPVIHRAVALMGFWNFAVPGLEADDLMGLASGMEEEYERESYLFSGDRDLYQLVSERTTLLRPRAGNVADMTITPERVLEETGLSVEQWPLFLALGGDSSDNIRPIPRHGEVRAAQAVLGGLRPDKPWDAQPRSAAIRFSKKIPLLCDMWRRVNDAYNIVVLPRNMTPNRAQRRSHLIYRYLEEERLEYALQLFVEPAMQGWLRWKGAPTASSSRIKEFVGFCADYGFEEFLAKRSTFIL